MARGHKTGGRQKGTPNKHKARIDAKFAEAAGQATTGLSPLEIASMMPLPVMLLAMRLEVECGQLRSAASIARRRRLTSTQRWLRERGGKRPRTHDQGHRRPAGVIPGFRTAAVDDYVARRPAANIRFSAATPMAASVCWPAKPRARRRGPICPTSDRATRQAPPGPRHKGHRRTGSPS